MRKYLIILFVFASLQLWGQKDIYESVRFDELSAEHSTLAIIPFFANLDLEQELSKEELGRLEELEGKAVQDALETYFGRGKKKKKFSVEFQNVENTNALLAQNNINYSNIDTYTIKQLSEILQVDGIVSGNIDLNVLLSRGVSDEVSFLDYLLGDANYGRIGIKISDGKTGKLLWKYENEITKKSGRNTTDLIDKMMKKMTRRFPYDKERKKTRKRT
ncbi:hypothetical protein [Lentiprolixibacter aurantiacus]|uniref:Uncharacterized protein n=1 Tax=Lentiprolixibacter aurantiacus TaxID=2993939 RepID=A0AAE3MM87_9FLAO|nr:hypothetical protein [Lentiprolixibacter aurantiacus]MCX2720034.1 hypothetical protein [Lentiprolixibacter aurantiacus]